MSSRAETPRVVGIIGAGRLGLAVARLALRAGLDVVIGASTADIRGRVAREAPGATAATAAEAARRGDVVVLALPLRRVPELDPALFRGSIVIDATNHLPVWDGPLPALAAPSTSEWVQQHLPHARVVKTLNHLAADELEFDAAPPGTPGRRALAVAGDEDEATRTVLALVERLGFDAVDAGPLAAGVALEPNSHAFNGLYTKAQLQALFRREGGRRP